MKTLLTLFCVLFLWQQQCDFDPARMVHSQTITSFREYFPQAEICEVGRTDTLCVDTHVTGVSHKLVVEIAREFLARYRQQLDLGMTLGGYGKFVLKFGESTVLVDRYVSGYWVLNPDGFRHWLQFGYPPPRD